MNEDVNYQMNLLSQQQAMSLGGSYQPMMNSAPSSYSGLLSQMALMQQQQAMSAAAYSGANPYSGLDPRSVLAQQTYYNAVGNIAPGNIFQQSMLTPSGSPLLNPYQQQGSLNNIYAQNFLSGSPSYPDQFRRSGLPMAAAQTGIHHPLLASGAVSALGGAAYGAFQGGLRGGLIGAGIGIAGGVLGSEIGTAGMSFAGNALGLGGNLAQMGLGAGRLDVPMYQQIRNLGEVPAESLAHLGLTGAQYGAQGGLALATLAGTYALAGSGPAGWAAGAAIGAGAYAVNKGFIEPGLKGPKEYMELGRYFRDSMAPVFRGERIGGGPTNEQVQQFQRGFADIAAKDKQLTRDDYTKLFQLANDEGLLQFTNNPEQVLKAIENIGKSAKVAITFGTKIKELNQTMQTMVAAGVDVTNPTQVAQFMGNTSTYGFMAGKNVTSMLPGMAQAGELYRQQGIAPIVGQNIHAQSQGIIGEAIREGSFTPQDMAYFGGRENMESSLTRTFAGAQRTNVGQLMMMALANNPDLAPGFQPGSMNLNQMMNQLHGLPVGKIFELEYNMPKSARDINLKNPNAQSMGIMGNLIGMLRDMHQDKNNQVPVATMWKELIKFGFNPDDLRVFFQTVEGAPEEQNGAKRDIVNKMQQLEMERLRPDFNIFTEQGRQNIFEKYFEPGIGRNASKIQGLIGGITDYFEDTYIENLGGEVIRRPKGLNNVTLLGNFNELRNNRRLQEQVNTTINSKENEIAGKLLESHPGMYEVTRGKLGPSATNADIVKEFEKTNNERYSVLRGFDNYTEYSGDKDVEKTVNSLLNHVNLNNEAPDITRSIVEKHMFPGGAKTAEQREKVGAALKRLGMSDPETSDKFRKNLTPSASLKGKTLESIKRDLENSDVFKLYKKLTGENLPANVKEVNAFMLALQQQKEKGRDQEPAITHQLEKLASEGIDVSKYQSLALNSIYNRSDISSNMSHIQKAYKEITTDDINKIKANIGALTELQSQIMQENRGNLRKQFKGLIPDDNSNILNDIRLGHTSYESAGKAFQELTEGKKSFGLLAKKILDVAGSGKQLDLSEGSDLFKQLQDSLRGSGFKDDIKGVAAAIKSAEMSKTDKPFALADELRNIAKLSDTPSFDKMISGGTTGYSMLGTKEFVEATKGFKDVDKLFGALIGIREMLSGFTRAVGGNTGKPSIQDTTLSLLQEVRKK